MTADELQERLDRQSKSAERALRYLEPCPRGIDALWAGHLAVILREIVSGGGGPGLWERQMDTLRAQRARIRELEERLRDAGLHVGVLSDERGSH